MRKKERQYIEEVLDYETRYEANNGRVDGYHPIVLKLLLSIFIRLGDLLIVLSSLIGIALLLLIKL